MIKEGYIVLFPFPRTDTHAGKLRPALVLRECPGQYDDWLVCMVSSQLRHEISELDVIIRQEDRDYAKTGLKVDSVIRVSRLAVVSGDILQGAIGRISSHQLVNIQKSVARWIENGIPPELPGRISTHNP